MSFSGNLCPEILINANGINNWFQSDRILTYLEQVCFGQKVSLNLGEVNFMDPKGVIMLLAISHKIYDVTAQKAKIVNIRSDVLSYLERIRFFKIASVEVDLNTLIWDKYSREGYSESVIQITKINSSEETRNIIEKLGEIILMWFPENKFRSLRHNTLLSILELCSNSLEHSSYDENGECFFMLQKSLERDYLELCIVTADFGIGIKNHLAKKYGDLFEHDYQYIKEALKGKSGRIDGSGGMGFQSIHSMIKDHNGSLTVRSSKGIVTISNKESELKSLNNMPGTQCSLVLRRMIK